MTEPEMPKDLQSSAEQAAQAIAKHPRTIRELVQGPEFRDALKSGLPRGMRPDRFIRTVLTAILRKPDLALATKESFFLCALQLSELGLEPDGRRAHLIPFRNRKAETIECTVIIDYKGLAELVRRSGDVNDIHCDVVYDRDEFSYGYGDGAHLRHKPNLESRGERRMAYYSYVELKTGKPSFMVMSPSEVEKVRQRSKSPNEGPWVTDYDEMGKKTVFRRHSKWLPLSPEVRDALALDDHEAVEGKVIPEAEQEPEPAPHQKARDQILAKKAALMETKLTAAPTAPAEENKNDEDF